VTPGYEVDELIDAVELDEHGAFVAPDELRARIAASAGCVPSLRPLVWPALLGLAPWSASADERKAALEASTAAYAETCARGDGAIEAGLLRVIDADVPRTAELAGGDEDQPVLRKLLVALAASAPEYSYWQGMNDLTAAVLAGGAAREPELAYWMLGGAFNDWRENWIHADLSGVWRQARAVLAVLDAADAPLGRRIRALEAAPGSGGGGATPLPWLFSALFLRLRRELASADEACRCWEVCWAAGEGFHVLVCCALVRSHRKFILGKKTRSVAQLHQRFGSGGARAAELLGGARRLHARVEVRNALQKCLTEPAGAARPWPAAAPLVAAAAPAPVPPPPPRARAAAELGPGEEDGAPRADGDGASTTLGIVAPPPDAADGDGPARAPSPPRLSPLSA